MKYLINYYFFIIKKMLDGQIEGGVKGVVVKKFVLLK